MKILMVVMSLVVASPVFAAQSGAFAGQMTFIAKTEFLAVEWDYSDETVCKILIRSMKTQLVGALLVSVGANRESSITLCKKIAKYSNVNRIATPSNGVEINLITPDEDRLHVIGYIVTSTGEGYLVDTN